jgi:hypothetical protein
MYTEAWYGDGDEQQMAAFAAPSAQEKQKIPGEKTLRFLARHMVLVLAYGTNVILFSN